MCWQESDCSIAQHRNTGEEGKATLHWNADKRSYLEFGATLRMYPRLQGDVWPRDDDCVAVLPIIARWHTVLTAPPYSPSTPPRRGAS
jgi:hypothetical protein